MDPSHQQYPRKLCAAVGSVATPKQISDHQRAFNPDGLLARGRVASEARTVFETGAFDLAYRTHAGYNSISSLKASRSKREKAALATAAAEKALNKDVTY